MPEVQHDLSTTISQNIEHNDNDRTSLTRQIVKFNTLACNFDQNDSSDIQAIQKETLSWLKALDAKGGLQEMLIAQMLSIHQLQQISIAMANGVKHIPHKQYFSNTAIKLANTFTQQANLLSKLQGKGEQKIIVEHVDVHSGGQAIVGNVHQGEATKK